LLNIKFDEDRQTTNARSLWEFLGRPYNHFTDWFNQYKAYGFTETVDFRTLSDYSEKPQGGRPPTDYEISIDMAKELCMLQKTEKGKQARQYFINLEKQWNSPEAVMARALKMADAKILEYKNITLQLQGEIKQQKPKVEYFDALVDSSHLTNIRNSAKEIGIKESNFIDWLILKGFLYREQSMKGRKGNLKPMAGYIGKYFEVKDKKNDVGWAGTQTYLTVEGKKHLRQRLLKEGLI